MDLSLTGEQEALQHSIRSLCEDRFPTAMVRACEENAGAADAIYRELFALGIGGIIVSEGAGGLALGLTDMVVAQTELGRALVPALFTESTILAAALLDGCRDGKASAILASLLSGEVMASCAWQEEDARGSVSSPATRLSDGEGKQRLDGVKLFVPEAGRADYLIVTARDADGAFTLCIVERNAGGIAVAGQPNLAELDMGRVTFSNAPVHAVIARGEPALATWNGALRAMKLAVAAQTIGGAGHILEITRDYAATRQQFGQPIGAFQAIAHMLAEAAVNLEGARLLVYRAAAAADDGDPFDTWVDLAKLKACQTFRDISALGIQVHGGIGFTLEADPQLFYRRAKHLQLMYGDPLDLQESAGEALIAGTHKVLQA